MRIIMQRLKRGGAIVLSLGAIVVFDQATNGFAQSSVEQLRTEVQTIRDSIKDFSVEFQFDAVKAPSNAVGFDHMLVAVKDHELFRMERHYGTMASDGEEPAKTFVAASFDGLKGYGYYQVTRMATVRDDGNIPLIDTEGSGYFDMLLYYPCSMARGEGVHRHDLLTKLDSAGATLRAEQQEIEGHLCHVLDLDSLPNGQPKQTIWLDAQRGLLPIQRHVFTRGADGNAQLLLELRIDEAVQLSEHVWMPTKGVRRTFAVGMNPDPTVATEYHMSVRMNADGTLAISLNTGLADSYFNYASELPPGTTVADLEAGTQWMVSSAEYQSGAEAAIASAGVRPAKRSEGVFTRFVSDAVTARPWNSAAWVALMACCAGVGAFVTIRQLRR